jgi:hypothetical protein
MGLYGKDCQEKDNDPHQDRHLPLSTASVFSFVRHSTFSIRAFA